MINQDMYHYMKNLASKLEKTEEIKDKYFRPKDKLLADVNKTIRNGNYYILDKYGLVIRKSLYGKIKNPMGWTYDENNEPINIHISDVLLKTGSEDIRDCTMSQLEYLFPNAFKPPRSILYKIFKDMPLSEIINKSDSEEELEENKFVNSYSDSIEEDSNDEEVINLD